ncbi:MAG: DUF1571 domain-containing protein [Gemmataceae bacterium]|nr:DUF1571 domain-containing protein [Gemmataceae bacterium]MDW8242736.1 DUF1571 domain-containing protein [Thermogemmata sp.]
MRCWVATAVAIVAGAGGGSLAQNTLPLVSKAGTAPPAGASAGWTGPISREQPADALTMMLREALQAHAQLRDYTCTFVRQERRQGVLGSEEVALLQVRVQPLGIRVRFVQPEAVAGLELAYSAHSRPDRIRLRPAGPEGIKGFRTLAVDDPQFLATHRYALPEWTIAALLQRLIAALERERNLRNPVEVHTADYRYAEREAIRYDILLRRPHAFRNAARMVVYVDKHNRLPLRYEAYTTAQPQPRRDDLLEMYSYTELRTNVGLSETNFAE